MDLEEAALDDNQGVWPPFSRSPPSWRLLLPRLPSPGCWHRAGICGAPNLAGRGIDISQVGLTLIFSPILKAPNRRRSICTWPGTAPDISFGSAARGPAVCRGTIQGDGLKAYTGMGTRRARTIGSVALLATSATLLRSCSYSDPAPSPVAPSVSQSPHAAAVSASPPDVAGEVQLSSYLPITYTAVAGDTWASIATAFGLKEASLSTFQARAISTEPAAGTLVDLRGSGRYPPRTARPSFPT
ncbi:MAG: hypothetical protein QOH19_1733 [Actinomycetota bacterium]|jgi:hypothetical protein|nr:hypothetical protein [Actinomycetota bacterium]